MTTNGYQRNDPNFVLPGSEEHRRVVTASKVASILNVSRWQSAYSLWHQMAGHTEPEPYKDIYTVGHAFEVALAELWKLENPGWRLSHGEVQFVTEEFGFPAMATVDRRGVRGTRRCLVEFKTARDLEEWGDPGLAGDLPMDYVTQVIFQQMVSGITATADMLVMGPFFKHFTYHIEYDGLVAAWIARECQAFWQSLQDGMEPELDNSVSTYTCVKELHPDIDGSEVEVPIELIVQLRELRAEIGPLETKQRGLKTELLAIMGDAATAHINGETVAKRTRHGKGGVALKVL